MADCSKTVDFLKERKRLCDSYKCKMCPVQPFFKIPDVCPLFDDDLCDEKLIDFVQKWSDEHPAPKPKTYADDFFEKFPKASKSYLTQKDYESGIAFPTAKRCHIYGIGIGCCMEDDCTRERQARCWNEPYKEEETNGRL